MSVSIQASDGSGAPPSFKDIDGSPNNFVFTQSILVFSGSYPTGGEPLDLTPLLQAGVPSGALPIQVFVEGQGNTAGTSWTALGNYYAIVLGSALTGYKVQLWSGGGAQLGAGAYPATVTNDKTTLSVVWRKLSN